MIKRTSKSISTISYNSVQYLQNVLADLIANERITFYAFVLHTGEEGDKDHIHLFIEPNGSIDVSNLRKLFDEPHADGTVDHCMPFVTSDYSNWYLYSRHDEDYLFSKHETKTVYNIPDTDFITSDSDEFSFRNKGVDRVQYETAFGRVCDCVKQGLTMFQAIAYLNIPMQQIPNFPKVWQMANVHLKSPMKVDLHDSPVDEEVNIMTTNPYTYL